MSNSLMVDGGASATGTEGEGVVSDVFTTDKVVLRKRKGGGKERLNGSNGVFSRPKSEYISPCKSLS